MRTASVFSDDEGNYRQYDNYWYWWVMEEA